MMRKVKLTKEELAIENSLEQFVKVDKQEYEQIVQAITARRKDAVLNVRVNSQDLASIKQRAQRLGIKYQTLISEVIHRIAQAN
jgi:predicted DNA binding CopG/RHH family protein